MLKKDKIKIIFLVVCCAFVFNGCSTQRNTTATRAYHELTTRYNVYFNAEMAYDDALQNIMNAHKDNYSELLPMYPNSSVPGDTIVKQSGGAFDRVIEKTSKAIQEHSISVKPMRDPKQMDNREYREWLLQSEFNPFIDQAWLLMGKAHVQNGDYAQAISILSQITRLFTHDINTVSEAQLWMLRAYTEMEWYTDAETVASTLNARILPNDLRKIFNEFYAFYLMRQHRFAEAIPFLEETAKETKDKTQKRRFRFLTGQLYALLGENEKAYAVFDKVRGISVPHELELNAILAQSQVTHDIDKTISALNKMAKRGKNINYVDQIYYSIGNIYLAQNDVDKAIENFQKAEDKSTQNTVYKALATVAQGDIYYDKKEFVKAEPKYREAVGSFPKDNLYHETVQHRAGVLGEMAPYITEVMEQDSILHLASLPEEEQLKVINLHIAELKKQDRNERRERQIEEFKTQDLFGDQSISTTDDFMLTPPIGGDATFYFYNPQLVAQGKNEFRRIWGNRAQEDNWRLADKSSIVVDMMGEERVEESVDIDIAEATDSVRDTDTFSPDFYLAQLPKTEEDFSKLGAIIREGLFNIGNIATDKLKDFDYAVDVFNRYLHDYPDGSHTLEIYSQLYLINIRVGDYVSAENYKNKILNEFVDSDIANRMADPDYDYIMDNYAQTQDLLYQNTLSAYRDGDYEMVQSNFDTAQLFFGDGDYMPQFRLLDALSYAQQTDSVGLKTKLSELTEKHPETLQAELAQNILTGLDEGKILAGAASALSDFDWNISSYEESAEADSVWFDPSVEQFYSYWLIMDYAQQNKNELLFAVSDYNFSTFQRRVFPVSFRNLRNWDVMQIDGFESLNEVRRYAEIIESDSLFAQSLPDSVRTLIISHSNIDLLNSGKTIEEYLVFYTQELDQNPSVIHKIEIESISEEEKADEVVQPEPAEVVMPEPVLETKPVLPPVKAENGQKTIEERQAELERKEAEALSQSEQVMSQKERTKMLKEREIERKKLIKERAAMLKQKEKERKAELRLREKERKQKLKEQERLRKEKLKERNRVLKKQNRQ